jgi:hypothetical protein
MKILKVVIDNVYFKPQSGQSAIGFLSIRPNWDPQASVPPLVPGRGGGGSQFGRGDRN